MSRLFSHLFKSLFKGFLKAFFRCLHMFFWLFEGFLPVAQRFFQSLLHAFQKVCKGIWPESPKGARCNPKRVPRSFKRDPRGAKTVLREPQEGPRKFQGKQGGPRDSQESLTGAQNSSKRAPRLIFHAFLCFLMYRYAGLVFHILSVFFFFPVASGLGVFHFYEAVKIQ